MTITKGEIQINKNKNVPYLHCGPKYVSTSSQPPKELLLLHGKSFNKETWVESNILQTLCQLDPELSVTAIDLPAVSLNSKESALELIQAFKGLAAHTAQIISGQPLVVISPSMSGKNIVGLFELTSRNDDDNDTLPDAILKGWVPVACGYVMQTTDEALSQINQYSIPTLAIYGNLDGKGKIASEKLKEIGFNHVEIVEMNGGHPVYLNDTDKFIHRVIEFMAEVTNK